MVAGAGYPVEASARGPRILLAGGGTGGHLVPALNLAEAIRRVRPEARLMFLGAERGVEARVLPESDWPHRLLPLQPIRRSRPWRNWRLLWTAPRVAAGLLGLFRTFRPDLVVGTGGYASGPAVLWASLRGIPTAIQEQNARPGLVTRWLAPRVDQLHLGYPEAEAHLRPGRRTRVYAYGNPVARPEQAGMGTRAGPDGFAWPDSGRILLVTGGSQGARGLNERLLADLERAAAGRGDPSLRALPEDVWIVWAAGPTHFESVDARVRQLPWSDRIRVAPFIERLGAHLWRASLAIARAGAMFVAELAAAGVPALFVPFPAAAGGHQSANARAMAEAGAALVREEAELEPGELWRLAAELMAADARRAAMAEAARERGRPEAAGRIAGELLRLAEGGGA